MSRSIEYSTIVFDLGDVLFRWSPETKTSISSRTLRAIISSPTWFNYERGRLSEGDCYAAVGKEFSLEPEEIKKAFQQARDSLVANHDLIDLIRELKAESRGRLRVFAMSNISLPDWEVLRTKPADWSIFDQVFTSGAAGERKPNLGFFRSVTEKADLDPRHTIFVDDKLENVLSARSLGFHGIVFDNPVPVKRALRNLVGDPVTRGREFLEQNAGKLLSVTDSSEKREAVILEENFAQLLILEATNDRTLVNLVEHDRTWNFFHGGKGKLTTDQFPFDLDTTSLGLTVFNRNKEVANSVMDEMLQYVDKDGIIQTYFDHRRPRFDPVVCVNALSLFYTYGRGAELHRTLLWVHDVLLNRAYLDGTRYYQTAECFLFFVSRLLSSTGDADLHALLKPLLRERIQERIGADGDALALAMRILVCDSIGIRDDVDFRALLPLQCEDGGWEISWIYKYGSSGIRIGNRGLTTSLAINAVEAMKQSPTHLHWSPSPTSTVVEQPPSPTKRHSSVITGLRPRSGSFKASFQRFWHVGKSRKAAEI
ncbi:Haloacid dehalogenase-like hydrolase-domain-containing protein [Crucibulum laeve]|uniref:Haloacid dehalogenase-like hydrolase-domain-containing protein n=1 Tax=Crucibulum laeve TaxID=68775 RepID=A0A5C3MK32_9AGAR|nr:Haloacid dehalogenase-like hydrolase-domain-containing protein [Crucibulum laeve]